MPHIKVGDVNLKRKFVAINRKGTLLQKKRFGEKVNQPIYTQEGYEILQKRCAGKSPGEVLFPAWRRDRIAELILYTARRHKWPVELKYDGPTSFGIRQRCSVWKKRSTSFESAEGGRPFQAPDGTVDSLEEDLARLYRLERGPQVAYRGRWPFEN